MLHFSSKQNNASFTNWQFGYLDNWADYLVRGRNSYIHNWSDMEFYGITGGIFYWYRCHCHLFNNITINNTAYRNYDFRECQVDLVNNTINYYVNYYMYDYGGSILSLDSNVTVTNSVFDRNMAVYGGVFFALWYAHFNWNNTLISK
jgi:hypothetical protein